MFSKLIEMVAAAGDAAKHPARSAANIIDFRIRFPRSAQAHVIARLSLPQNADSGRRAIRVNYSLINLERSAGPSGSFVLLDHPGLVLGLVDPFGDMRV